VNTTGNLPEPAEIRAHNTDLQVGQALDRVKPEMLGYLDITGVGKA